MNRTVAWRWLVPRYSPAILARASTDSGRTFEGPEPNRPSPGSRSGGIVISGVGVLVTVPLWRPVPRISKRIAAIAESATLAVDAKAKALKAAGEPVIGFGAGEPDFPTPPHIVQAAIEAASEPKNHRYTPTPGLPELKAAIAEKTLRDSGVEITPEQVVVTNGGKHAVYNTLLTLLDEGDEALLPAPYWTT